MSTVFDDNPNIKQAPNGLLYNWVADRGGLVIDSTIALGAFSLFVWETAVWMFTRLPRSETIWPNFYRVGVSSLPVVALIGTFIGMVLAVQSYFQFSQFGLLAT